MSYLKEQADDKHYFLQHPMIKMIFDVERSSSTADVEHPTIPNVEHRMLTSDDKWNL